MISFLLQSQLVVRSYPIFVLILGGLTILGIASMDLYLPAIAMIAEDFNASQATIQLSVSFFVLALGIGQFFLGPLIDHFGRRKMFFIASSVYILGTLGCAIAQNTSTLIAMRIIQALGVCIPMIISLSGSRDIASARQRAKVIGYVSMITSLSPILAPMVGAYLVTHTGSWRSNFIAMLALSATLTTIAYYALPETPYLRTEKVPLQFFARYRTVITCKYYWFFTIMSIICFSAISIFIVNGAYLFMNTLHLSPKAFASVLAATGSMIIVGNFLGQRAHIAIGQQPTLLTGATMILLSGSALSVTFVYFSSNLLGYILPLMLMIIGVMFIFPVTMSASLSPFTDNASSASGLLSSLRWIFSGITASIISLLIKSTLLAFSGAIMIIGIALIILIHSGRKIT